MKKIIYIILIMFFSFSICIALDITSQENSSFFELKNSATNIGDDIVTYKNIYSPQCSVILLIKGRPFIDKNKTDILASSQAIEVKKYLSYWLNYWGISVKPAEVSVNINSNLNQEETLTLTLIGTHGRVFTEKEYEDINKSLKLLATRKDVVNVISHRTFEVKLNSMFIDTSKCDLNFSSSFILDNIIDIIKIYGNGTLVKIQVNKNPIFLKNKSIDFLIKQLTAFSYVLEKKGLDKRKIHLLAKETEKIQKPSIEVFILKDNIKNKTDLDLFLDKNDSMSKIDFFKKKKEINKNNINVNIIYKDSNLTNPKFFPTGWVGDVNDLYLDFANKENQYSGDESIKIVYKAMGTQGWAGVYWQYPENNWGNKPDSVDLRDYSKLVFFARGEKGGEQLTEVKVGGTKGKYSDSDTAWRGNIVLTTEWQKYSISLKGKNLSRIISGFSFTLTKFDNRYGCTIYLDDIYFE